MCLRNVLLPLKENKNHEYLVLQSNREIHFKLRFIFYGYNFINFTDILSYNKIATQSLTYPSPSSDARNAVDGNTATCTKQMDIGFNTQYKTVWWKVDLGDVYNIYSISILFKTYDGYGR